MQKPWSAEADLEWYFQQSDGDAAGMRGIAHEPTATSSTLDRDFQPETRSGARMRLRRVYCALVACEPTTRATLEARFSSRGRRASVPGLRELTGVILALPCVQERARVAHVEPSEAARTMLRDDATAKRIETQALEQVKRCVEEFERHDNRLRAERRAAWGHVA